MSLSSGLTGILASLRDLLTSLLATLLAIAQTVLHAVQSLLVGTADLLRGVVSQAVHLAGGTAKFITGNFLALAVGGLLVFVYLRYYSGGGGRVGALKKTQ